MNTPTFEAFLNQYGLDRETGFIDSKDPLDRLPQPEYSEWEHLASEAAHLVMMHAFRRMILKIPPALLRDEAWCGRAHLILSILAHAYIRGCCADEPVEGILPRQIAEPFVAVSKALGTEPICTYYGTTMINWRRIDPKGPVELDNLLVQGSYSGCTDEAWFFLVATAMEARSGKILQTAFGIAEALKEGSFDSILQGFLILAEEIQVLTRILERMREHCDPQIFLHKLRPTLAGWKSDAQIKAIGGIVYEGTREDWNHLVGASGVQSPLMQAIDVILGIEHDSCKASCEKKTCEHIQHFRSYMIDRHRCSLGFLEEHLDLRHLLRLCKDSLFSPVEYQALLDALNRCIRSIQEHRIRHLVMVRQYIIGPSNDASIRGTGGTEPVKFLKKILCESSTIKDS